MTSDIAATLGSVMSRSAFQGHDIGALKQMGDTPRLAVESAVLAAPITRFRRDIECTGL